MGSQFTDNHEFNRAFTEYKNVVLKIKKKAIKKYGKRAKDWFGL